MRTNRAIACCLFLCLAVIACITFVRAAAGDDASREAALKAWLARDFPSRIEAVEVQADQIVVRGFVEGGEGGLVLVESPMHADGFDAASWVEAAQVAPDAQGDFFIAVPRRLEGAGGRDRLLSRWLIARREGERLVPASRARYADAIACASPPAPLVPGNKKGLGALGLDRPLEDIEELGVSAVTVNVVLNGLLREQPVEGVTTPHLFSGRTWHVDERRLSSLDKTLQFAQSRNLLVSAIVLIRPSQRRDEAWSRLAAHPDARREAFYAMPNVNDENGLAAYAAALDLLARRYGRAEAPFGRIHHWIMHNEVDQGWTWTNAGKKTALAYFDLYHKSLRAAHLIARQYDPHAQAFISLTHHWTVASDDNSYVSRDLLDLLETFCRAEGDFDWAIAHHPYPEDLRDPRVWEDKHVDFTLNTPKITFKNIEVLDAWARQPQHRFQGRLRTIHLSEQGLNSPDYSEESLLDQAAGMAYAWAKIEKLESIRMFHYHNWVDNRGEFGLRLGLRRFPDDDQAPLGKKPIWRVFQTAGAPEQAQAHAFALPIVGARAWDEVRHLAPIE